MFQSRMRTVFAATVLAAVSAGTAHAQVLKGSPASVDRMYRHASSNSFEFFRTATAIRNAVKAGDLVALKGNSDYELHQVQYPYVLPAAKLFVDRLASQYRGACGEKMVVTSAARPMNSQPANASDKSVHTTGMAVDIRSTKISSKCAAWLRKTLVSLEQRGVIEATEEIYVPHFHVAIFPAPYRQYVAQLSASASAVVAEADEEASGPAGSADLQLVSYIVRSGDSLWKIATKHDTTVQALQDLNSLRKNTIQPGQVILVPAGASPR